MRIQNLVKFCPFILRILNKNHILTSITSRYSTLNIDLVNDNVCTKFGSILSIRSKDMEQKQILMSVKDSNSVVNLQNTTIYDTNVDLVNKDVYTKFGLILSIRS